MFEGLIKKMLYKEIQNSERISRKMDQQILQFNEIIGSLELLIRLVEDGKEVENAKRELLPLYLKINEDLLKFDRYLQKSRWGEDKITIKYKKKIISNQINKYGEKISQLQELFY
jgi:hypothetical protein